MPALRSVLTILVTLTMFWANFGLAKGLTQNENQSQAQKEAERNKAKERLSLSSDDRWILNRGEVSDVGHVAGALLAIYPGFGLGQVAQGRWTDTGWIVTSGELALGAAVAIGLFSCAIRDSVEADGSVSCTGLSWAYAGFLGFRIYGIYDAIAGPSNHNQRYRELKSVYGKTMQPDMIVTPIVTNDRSLGLGVAFNF